MQCPNCDLKLDHEFHEDAGPKDRNTLYWCPECDYQALWRQLVRPHWQVIFPGAGKESYFEDLTAAMAVY